MLAVHLSSLSDPVEKNGYILKCPRVQNADLLVPWVLVTKVLPMLRMLNMAGAFTSYQSFLENGSTLWTRNSF